MFSFPELIRTIRKESGLNQTELADRLGVSKILISMVETGQKEVSKNMILKLAYLLDVHPTSLAPFLFVDDNPNGSSNGMESALIKWGETLQQKLVRRASRKLRKYD